MTDIRKEVHGEIDRMTDREVAGLKEFLAFLPESSCRYLSQCPGS